MRISKPSRRRKEMCIRDRDYIGAVQGIPVCFDAKECDSDTFPLQNIHEHQVKFMEDFERQEGVAFLIIFFSHRNELYYLSYQRMREFWDRAAAGGRKSFRHEELLSLIHI